MNTPKIECICPVAGYCSRRNTHINPLHWKQCQDGRIEHVDEVYERIRLHREQTIPDYTPKQAVEAGKTSTTKTGVGDFLHAALAKFGIKEAPGCKCNSHKNTLNLWGPKVSRDNIETIIDWMQEEAAKRKLPFVRVAAKMLVLWAIKQSEKHSLQA